MKSLIVELGGEVVPRICELAACGELKALRAEIKKACRLLAACEEELTPQKRYILCYYVYNLHPGMYEADGWVEYSRHSTEEAAHRAGVALKKRHSGQAMMDRYYGISYDGGPVVYYENPNDSGTSSRISLDD